MNDPDFESRILRFERAWQGHSPPDIAEFLESSPFQSPEGRRRLLLELICVDLEFRWRNAEDGLHTNDRPHLLEDYAARHPELGPPDLWPVELIGEEYRVRHRWGDRPSHGTFLERFSARCADILAALERVDHDLEEEEAPARLDLTASLREPPPPPDDIPDLAIGVPIVSDKDLQLRRMIGAGRMGKVYQARHHGEGHDVAVKFLRKTYLAQPPAIHRFMDEARTIARLDHPHIVGIRGLGRTIGGAYFLVMDLVDGPNLAQLGASREITLAEAIRWAIQLCDAVAHAHTDGVVHCDLKPANLLLAPSGDIRVTDFGLARTLGTSSLTADIEGTAPFMAPEQASRAWGPVGPWTDLYGIGAVLYTLLTGRPPWNGRRLADVLVDVVSGVPVPPAISLRPSLPRSLSDLCERCLHKNAASRYETIQGLRLALLHQVTSR